MLAGLKRIDTSVSGPIAHKYATLRRVVANFQPADVGRIFSCCQDAMTFLPHCGLHTNEFCLAYCSNPSHKRADGRPSTVTNMAQSSTLAHGCMFGSTVEPAPTEKEARGNDAQDRKRRRVNPVAAPPLRLPRNKHAAANDTNDVANEDANVDDALVVLPLASKRRRHSPGACCSTEPTPHALHATKTTSPQRKRRGH